MSGNIEFGDFSGIVGVVKFDIGDDGDVTYSFTSNRNPVYHNMAVKTDNPELLTNAGLGLEETSMDVNQFIAGPNSVAVPEPSALLYGGLVSVLAGCAYRRGRRR